MPGHIELKTSVDDLRALADRLFRGEEVDLVVDGRVVGRAVPAGAGAGSTTEDRMRRERDAALRASAVGMYGGDVWMAADFDDPLPDDIQKHFDDPEITPQEEGRR